MNVHGTRQSQCPRYVMEGKGMTAKAKKSWLAFLIFYVSYMSLYLVRYNFSVASAVFESGGILTKAQIGFIGSVFSLAYAIVKIPAGFLGDRCPPRWLIGGGLLLTAVSNLLISQMMSFLPIAVLWGVNSCGQALIWGPVLRALSDLYGRERGHELQQYFITCTSVGSIAGLLAASFLLERWPVQWCFLAAGTVPLVMAGAVFAVTARSGAAEVSEPPKCSPLQSAVMLWKTPDFRIKMFPAIANGLVKDNLSVWLVIYFMDRFGMDVKSMSGFVLFVPVMILVGKLIFPPLNRLLKAEARVSILCFGVAVLALIPLIAGTPSPAVAMICLGVTAAMASAVNTHLLIPPASYAASGSIALCASMMDVLVYGGAGIGSLFFGLMIARWGFGSMFATWAAASAISLVILAAAEKHTKKP